VIGAGVAGRCAPTNVNYEHFTAATPTAEQIVVPDLGHADVLCGRAQALGRLLCGGSAQPEAARATVSELMLDFLSRV
jgi:hypothetical protein